MHLLCNYHVKNNQFVRCLVLQILVCLFVVSINISFKNLIFSEKHVTQLQNLPVTEVNRLLGAVVDVENIFMSMHREDDHDTKRVYYYLFKVRNRFKFYTRLLRAHLGRKRVLH